jgi:hypothetical protein
MNVLEILNKEYWDSLVKLRDDMLNEYKKEIENAEERVPQHESQGTHGVLGEDT